MLEWNFNKKVGEVEKFNYDKKDGHKKYLMNPDDAWQRNDRLSDKTIRQEYKLEYIDNKKTWDNLENYINPWEHYEVVEFETIWDAMGRYLRYLFSDQIYDVKMWYDLYINDELVLEETIQFDSSFPHSMAKIINEDVIRNRDTLRKEIDEVTKENEIYKQFVHDFHADETFEEWREKNA